MDCMRGQVVIVGQPARTQLLGLAHQSAGLAATSLTLREAAEAPGFLIGADLVVFAARPGRAPTLETQAFLAAGGCLYASWGHTVADVGPHAARLLGPCPRCLARGGTPPPAGSSAALGAWACAWTALQSVSILDHGISELVGTSWRWSLDEPGLTATHWTRAEQCRTPGCRQA